MSFNTIKVVRWCLVFTLLFVPALMFSHHHTHRGCAWNETDSVCDFGCCFREGNQLDMTIVNGTLERVNVLSRAGVQSIEIKTDQGQRLTVLLAPVWYLKERRVELKAGDSLAVTCARLSGSEAARYAAIELTLQNGTSIELRDEEGFPLWQRGHAHCCSH